ncbi:hypothetical protein N7495_007017 [Penicillium taxi]|uniref:uncharacterized protein n=1 Tax=Penicillium taxi TaxID=168475 RepID=UPI0025458B95|nr:uncharacterized protein N7495_007017 [Penicillium taxi]KAJ5895326.1 hypothetical protein N7495_007017 [Penicillium taxi]
MASTHDGEKGPPFTLPGDEIHENPDAVPDPNEVFWENDTDPSNLMNWNATYRWCHIVFITLLTFVTYVFYRHYIVASGVARPANLADPICLGEQSLGVHCIGICSYSLSFKEIWGKN